VTASQNPLPDIADEEGSFGGGGLADKGEDLVLLDADGVTIDSLLFASSGWPAGDAKTKETMQRSGSTWITGLPTPKESTSATQSGGDQDDGGAQDDDENDTTDSVKKASPLPPVSPSKPRVEFSFPKTVYRGVPYEFVTEPVLEYDYRVTRGMFVWNMGDGTIIRQHDLLHPWYVYAYTVSFAYYDEPSDLRPILAMTKVVQVLDPDITLAVLDDGALRLTNASTKLVDIVDWKIVSSYRTYTIPPMTTLAPKASIVMPTSVLGFAATNPTIVQTPNGAVVARVGDVPTIQKQAVRSSYQAPPAAEQLLDTQAIPDVPVQAPKEKSHTKTIVVGIAVLLVMTLFVLLERAMASKE
jgi:hypothetical protein